MSDTIEFNQVLDTSGKCCPMPMVETNKTIKKMRSGEVLQIIASDPGTEVDIPSWCERTGNKLLQYSNEEGSFVYYVEKG